MSLPKIIEDEKGKKFIIPKPPDQVFLYQKAEEAFHTQQHKDPLVLPLGQQELILMIDNSKGHHGVTYPETGGMYVWHQGKQYPRKGHVYPEALRDLFYPKRILLSFMGILGNKDMLPIFAIFALLPKRMKGKIIERFIDGYLYSSFEILQPHYLNPRFNMDICRALSQVIMDFIVAFGVNEEKAAKFSLILITLLEYDMAYRLRLEDLLSETTKEKLLANPVKEIEKLIRILAERDPRRPHLVKKFDKFAKLMKYGFFFIREPFRKALAPVKFEMLQLDDIDRYHVRHWTGYNWMGMTIEERVAKWPLEKVHGMKLVPDIES